MNQQFYQTNVSNPFIPTFNPTINSSRIDYPTTSAKKNDCKECQTAVNNFTTASLSLNNKSIVIKRIQYFQIAILKNQDDYEKKLQQIEQSHQNEIKSLEQRMQQQIDSIYMRKQQEDQQREFTEVRQQIYELQSSFSGNNYHQQYFSQNEFEKLEKQLKKKKNKLQNQKVQIESLKQELNLRQQRVNELEIKLHYAEKQPIYSPQIIHAPAPVIRSPMPQQPIYYDSPDLIERIRNLELERDVYLLQFQDLLQTLRQVQSQSVSFQKPSIDEWNKLMHEYKILEADNNKLNTIILQKDDLIRSLEQRISVELTKQSALLAQGNPARPISVYYDPQTQQPIQPILEQQSNVQPTLQTSTQ